MKGEDLLKIMISSGNPEIVQTIQSEITAIITTIIEEQNLGTRFYKASTMKEMKDPKEIFKAMINDDIHFRPVKGRELEYIEMFQGLEGIQWI